MRQIPKPFLKWAGGKSRWVHELCKFFPRRFESYHEPFLGSGAVFFHLFKEGKIKKAFLSDANCELIDTYIAVRDHVKEVISLLSDMPYSKELFYELREKDGKKLSLPERASRFIYLNRTCYNGLYRVNAKGKFNVPFGRYKNPKIFDAENLLAVSKALQIAEIKCEDFRRVVKRVEGEDLVYFDPPYYPLSKTSSFTSYYTGGFSEKDHTDLRDICLELSRMGVFTVVSNSCTDFIIKLYSLFYIREVYVSRPINCMGDKRGKVKELVITNF
ncbi:MAG: DNA adenine methylase [Hydrogenobacter sp.]